MQRLARPPAQAAQAQKWACLRGELGYRTATRIIRRGEWRYSPRQPDSQSHSAAARHRARHRRSSAGSDAELPSMRMRSPRRASVHVDAIDVIEKLRPNMTLEPPDLWCLLPGLEPVREWQLILVTHTEKHSRTRRGRHQAGPSSRAHPARRAVGSSSELVAELSTIKPEHIESIEYHDCMSHSSRRCRRAEHAVRDAEGWSAFFQPGRGSFLLSDSAAKGVPSIFHVTQATSIRPYRMRILGVFDELSAAARLRRLDVETGVHRSATETGTACRSHSCHQAHGAS